MLCTAGNRTLQNEASQLLRRNAYRDASAGSARPNTIPSRHDQISRRMFRPLYVLLRVHGRQLAHSRIPLRTVRVAVVSMGVRLECPSKSILFATHGLMAATDYVFLYWPMDCMIDCSIWCARTLRSWNARR
jgi:hypothetical protein